MRTQHLFLLPRIVVEALLVALFAITAVHAETWSAVQDKDLRIQPGSILDFSTLVDAGPAGKDGHVIANANGQLVFADSPAKRKRFLCASQPYGIEQGFPDHATADRYARQLRMHGYNLARFVFVETVLMTGRTRDFDFDPVQLDRWHYFMAALKREGIYWMLDALTSWNGAYGDVGKNRWAPVRNAKAGVHFNEQDRAHWRQLVIRLLATPNPYTRLAPLSDPALMGVILVNEGGLNHHINLRADDSVDRAFAEWLAVKYGSVAQARRAWGELGDSQPVGLLPRRVWDASPRMEDAQRFYYAKQTETIAWMTRYLRSLRYEGLISAYDNWPNLQDSVTRGELAWVDLHAYHDEPTDFVTPGSSIRQDSSMTGALQYVRDMAISRYWGKPFTVSEYDQPFWNKWRFESGPAVGAFAAFQDWDLICRHASGPIELEYDGKNAGGRRVAMYPFGIGMDPIARAGETLAALLFLRSDVAPAKHQIEVPLTDAYVFGKHAGIGKLPAEISKLALVTGLGVTRGDVKGDNHRFRIEPQNNGSGTAAKAGGKLTAAWSDPWSAQLGSLRKTGVLSKENLSNGLNVFQSDTGEIILDTKRQTLRVITPYTEAHTFAEELPERFGRLRITRANGPAMSAISAMDGRVLAESGRVLLILAADARNTGMQFAGPDEKKLVRLGRLPILMRNIRVDVVLEHLRPTALALYALRLNGERGERIRLDVVDGTTVAFTLDTGSLGAGPTTFFELVEK